MSHLHFPEHRNLRSIFSARQHICFSALYVIACPSVCLSVTRVNQSKAVEVKIMQLSPQSSPMTPVSSRLTSPWNSKGKIGSGDAKWETFGTPASVPRLSRAYLCVS